MREISSRVTCQGSHTLDMKTKVRQSAPMLVDGSSFSATSLLKALAGVWALGYLLGCATASPAPGAPPGWGARAWVRYLTDPLPAEGGDTAAQAPVAAPPGMPSPWEEQRPPAQLAEARASEVARAWATVDSLSSASLPQGTRLRFLWWKQQGAFTLLSHQALRPLAPAAEPPQRPHALEHEVKRLLGDMAGQHSGAVELQLLRLPSGWTVDYRAADEVPKPLGMRQRPVLRQGVASSSWLRAREVATTLLKPLEVPAGGEVRLEAQVRWEDGRLVEARTRSQQVLRRGGKSLPVSPEVVEQVTGVLLGLSEGLGPRTTRLHLRALHAHGSARAQAWVEEAGLVQPERPPLLDEDFAAAWYAMHEEILRRWPEEVKDGSQWVLKRGAEEFAIWYIGGIIGKGAGALLEFVPKVMQTVLARGGQEAAAWLRTALVRLSPVEKESFQRLWAKLLVEGEQALSHSERQALRQTMLLLEQRLKEPLTHDQRDQLRRDARTLFMKLRPEFAPLMQSAKSLFPVHHQCPLEHAHLFTELDINSVKNLVLLQRRIHDRVGALWTTFRQKRPNPSAEDVDKMVILVHKHFKDWFNRTDIPDELPKAVMEAENAARLELSSLF